MLLELAPELDLAPELNDQELFADVDIGNPQAAARNDLDEAVIRKALNGFAHWRTPKADALGDCRLGDPDTRRQFGCQDEIFNFPVGLVCKTFAGFFHVFLDALTLEAFKNALAILESFNVCTGAVVTDGPAKHNLALSAVIRFRGGNRLTPWMATV